MPPHLLQVLQLVIFLCCSLWKHEEETFVTTVFLTHKLLKESFTFLFLLMTLLIPVCVSICVFDVLFTDRH